VSVLSCFATASSNIDGRTGFDRWGCCSILSRGNWEAYPVTISARACIAFAASAISNPSPSPSGPSVSTRSSAGREQVHSVRERPDSVDDHSSVRTIPAWVFWRAVHPRRGPGVRSCISLHRPNVP
jgi:hypothetical protein